MSAIEEAIATAAATAAADAADKAATEAAIHAVNQAQQRTALYGWLEPQPLWQALKPYAIEHIDQWQRVIIDIDASPEHLVPFALVTKDAGWGAVPYVLWSQGHKQHPEKAFDLTEVVVKARAKHTAIIAETKRKADEQERLRQQQATSDAYYARLRAEELTVEEAAREERQQRALAYERQLIDYAEALAAVHNRNWPKLKTIADDYGSTEFMVTALEIGIVAHEDDANYVDTETRIVLGEEPDADDFWSELSENEPYITRKTYMHIVSVAKPVRHVASKSSYAIRVHYLATTGMKINPVTAGLEIYPRIYIPPNYKEKDVLELIRNFNLQPEPDCPPTPANVYNSEINHSEQLARKAYLAARNTTEQQPAPTRPTDIDF